MQKKQYLFKHFKTLCNLIIYAFLLTLFVLTFFYFYSYFSTKQKEHRFSFHEDANRVAFITTSKNSRILKVLCSSLSQINKNIKKGDHIWLLEIGNSNEHCVLGRFKVVEWGFKNKALEASPKQLESKLNKYAQLRNRSTCLQLVQNLQGVEIENILPCPSWVEWVASKTISVKTSH